MPSETTSETMLTLSGLGSHPAQRLAMAAAEELLLSSWPVLWVWEQDAGSADMY